MAENDGTVRTTLIHMEGDHVHHTESVSVPRSENPGGSTLIQHGKGKVCVNDGSGRVVKGPVNSVPRDH